MVLKRIYFVLLPGTHILDFAGPLQALDACNDLQLHPLQIVFCGPDSEVTFSQGCEVSNIQSLPQRLDAGDVVFVLGKKANWERLFDDASKVTISWLKQVSQGVDDVLYCSVCAGVYLLAEAGLLDNRSCTTHHALISEFSTRYKKTQFLENRIFVKDGPIWSSAGISAGTDLAIELIARYIGEHVAIDVARDLVLDIRRSSQDPQLPIALRYRNHLDQAVHKVQDALSRQIDYPWNEDELAALVHKSYRQLSRIFKHNTGIGIKEYQMQVRVDYGRKLLLNTDLSINEISQRCGYEHAQTFRRAWHKYEQLNPVQYRRFHSPQAH